MEMSRKEDGLWGQTIYAEDNHPSPGFRFAEADEREQLDLDGKRGSGH
jgi:hypothetical protein